MRRPRLSSPMPWGAAAALCFVLVLPLAVWADWFDGEISPATAIAGAALVGVGAVCFAVATALRSQAEHASFLRTLGRTLWAPIRFLLELP